MEAIRIHRHESIVGAPLVKMSTSKLSAQAGTVVPPRPQTRLCRLGLGSAMPDLCSVLASPALDVVHALTAPINDYILSFSTHPPCNMLWDAGCLDWCLPQSCYRTPKVITGLGGLGLARREKEPVETNTHCWLFSTKPPAMAFCHGILRLVDFCQILDFRRMELVDMVI